jgi:hypothetical protein
MPSIFHFFAVILLLSAPAFAAGQDTGQLACETKRPDSETLALSTKIVDGIASVQENEENALHLNLDASLAPGSFLFVLQDNAMNQRLAFVGAVDALNWEGARLEMDDSRIGCKKTYKEYPQAFPAPMKAKPANLVCMLDEATYEKGELKQSKRMLVKAVSTFSFGRPTRIEAENEAYAYSLSYNVLNAGNGLQIKLRDKGTGKNAQFTGPARTLTTSVILGFTQGDKAQAAKFLRLGCVYADDLSPYKE